jgi:hypothetical protein
MSAHSLAARLLPAAKTRQQHQASVRVETTALGSTCSLEDQEITAGFSWVLATTAVLRSRCFCQSQQNRKSYQKTPLSKDSSKSAQKKIKTTKQTNKQIDFLLQYKNAKHTRVISGFNTQCHK